ncbi:MAG: RICIN domain-containing protein [Clostridia bacterium]|nr:RICIN domain-containing protein [Clostridia bacterium]
MRIKKTITFFSVIMFFILLCAIKQESKAATITDGEYVIKSAVNDRFVLDITEASKADLANVEIWSNNGGNNQKFYIKNVGNGEYTIIAKHSNRSLDVPGLSNKEGTSLKQYSYNGGTNQKWILKETPDGYFNIVSKCNGLLIDVVEGKMRDGTDVVMWGANNGKNQKFKIVPVTTTPVEKNELIEDGIYQIKSALNEEYILDVTGASKKECANIELWRNNNGNNQKYRFKNVGNGYYTIENINSKLYFDVEGDSKKEGANLIQYGYSGKDNQKWMLRSAGNGYYYIISKSSNLCIDLDHSKVADGTNVLMWSRNYGNNQKFKLVKTTETIQNNTGRSEEFKKQHPEIKVGIDVSRYQGVIDWNKVKKDGIDYAMIRAGFRGYGESGSLNEDTMFEQNVKGARAAGLDVGVYFFSQARNYDEGVKEAEYTINLIKKFDITYPVAFDTEQSSSPTNTGRADNISVQDRTDATKGFCSTIEKAGYKTLIYASPYWLNNYLDMNQLSQYKIWLANYTGATQENPLAKPSSYKGQYVMWQYTDCGTINGIDGGVDCNIFFYEEMR